MNRANCSAKTPKLSESYAGRRTSGRRTSRGVSSLERRPGCSATAHPLLVAPSLGEHVVEQVVDRDGPEQATFLVDHRGRDEVVHREVAGHLLERRVRLERVEVRVDHA